MEVLLMLKEQGTKLTDEELQFLIDELNTGEYGQDYIEECFELIREIKKSKTPENVSSSKEPIHSIVMSPEEIKNGVSKDTLTMEERFWRDIEVNRTIKSSQHVIEEYVKEQKLSNEFFIKNINKLNDSEIETLFKYIVLTDEQIESIFGLIPSGLIEKTQHISEEFFIKHFDALNIKMLKNNKVTDWIKDPSLRSKKLVIFLKMKGVNL